MKSLPGTSARRACALAVLLLPALSLSARADLTGYWPLDTINAGTTPNLAPGGSAAGVFGGVTAVFDATRNNNVFAFDGLSGSYVDAGSIPQLGLTTPYTWSLWAQSLNNGDGNNLILGNRYDPTGAEFNPREFIKFTPTKFEYHRNATGENLDYADLVLGEWHNHVIVKEGSSLIYLRDGVVVGIAKVTAGLNNPQPLYMGGNAATENWNGRIDNVATWNNAVPLSSLSAIYRGTATPLTAPATFATQVTFSDSFNGAGLDTSKWTPTNRGLENNAPAGYNGPAIVSGGVSGTTAVQLGGVTNNQYWYGDSIESIQTFSGSVETMVSVQRMSLVKSGSAARSSLWLLGDDGHYLQFAQNVGETGWSWNSRDDGGTGTLAPTGGGNNILSLDSLDNDLGQHQMGIRIASAGVTGAYNLVMYFDNQAVAFQYVTNWPDTFRVILTGQARAANDTGLAVFDDLQVLQAVPEPGTAALLLSGAALALARPRRRLRTVA